MKKFFSCLHIVLYVVVCYSVFDDIFFSCCRMTVIWQTISSSRIAIRSNSNCIFSKNWNYKQIIINCHALHTIVLLFEGKLYVRSDNNNKINIIVSIFIELAHVDPDILLKDLRFAGKTAGVTDTILLAQWVVSWMVYFAVFTKKW